MKTRSIRLITGIIIAALLFAAAGCAVTPEDRTTVRVATIAGPSGIGMVRLMEQDAEEATDNDYTFTVDTSAQNVASLVISGQVDMACVPVNLAATLYNKTEGNIRLLAVYTLGMLHILENGTTVESIEDLAGRTLHVSGEGALPEYVIKYILDAYDLTDDVPLELYADHDELAALAAAGEVDLCMLPEPKVTAVLAQNEDLRLALDVTDVWEAAAARNGQDGSQLAMGGVIVNATFLEEHPDAVDAFLAEYEESIDYAVNNVTETSLLVEEYGIMPKAAVAAQAIPNCNIVYIDGADLPGVVDGLLQALYAYNPQSVGGELPGTDFYHTD